MHRVRESGRCKQMFPGLAARRRQIVDLKNKALADFNRLRSVGTTQDFSREGKISSPSDPPAPNSASPRVLTAHTLLQPNQHVVHSCILLNKTLGQEPVGGIPGSLQHSLLPHVLRHHRQRRSMDLTSRGQRAVEDESEWCQSRCDECQCSGRLGSGRKDEGLGESWRDES